MNWHPHTETPNVPDATTALLAIQDEGEIILAGMYLWRGGQWICEETFKPCGVPHWWALEDEIVATINTPSTRANHGKA